MTRTNWIGRMTWRLRIVAVALLFLLLAATAAASALAAGHRRPVVLHPHWRIVGHEGESTDGSYTILWREGHGGVLGTLVDERTGRHRPLRLPRFCPGAAAANATLGDTYVVADCGSGTLALYALGRNRWRRVAVRGPCRARQLPSCPAVDVGSRWIEYDSGTANTGDVYVFQNIATGRIRRDPTSRHVIADLNAPGLARRLCAPIDNPGEFGLTFAGRFALVEGDRREYLRECGRRLYVSLGSQPTAATIGPTAVLYDAIGKGPVHGILLPSLRRFTITDPPGAFSVDFVDLSLGHIYLDAATRGNGFDVWSAPVGALMAARP